MCCVMRELLVAKAGADAWQRQQAPIECIGARSRSRTERGGPPAVRVYELLPCQGHAAGEGVGSHACTAEVCGPSTFAIGRRQGRAMVQRQLPGEAPRRGTILLVSHSAGEQPAPEGQQVLRRSAPRVRGLVIAGAAGLVIFGAAWVWNAAPSDGANIGAGVVGVFGFVVFAVNTVILVATLITRGARTSR